MFSDLITSKVRIKVLQFFLNNPQQMCYVRDCVRQVGEEINAVRRDLILFEEKGILKSERRSNRLYYYLSKDYPFYDDLLRIASRTMGLGKEILSHRVKLGKIKFAMFSGKFVKREKKSPDEVDLIIVGTVVLPELAILVRNEEARIGIEINYTAMSEEEFKFRKQRNDPFLTQILYNSRVMIIGDEEAMIA